MNRSMQSIALVALVVATSWACPSRARAAIQTFLAPVPIAPQAVAADPVLAGYQTWDLRINVPAGSSFGYTGFLAELTEGQFYNSPLGHQIPLPQVWSVFPQLRYDTFVVDAADPDDDATFVGPFIQGGYPMFPAPVEFTETRTGVSFISNYGHFSGPGIFTIARLTITNDASGSVVGYVDTRGGGQLMNFAHPLPIPEPAALSAGLLVLVGLLRPARRTRQRRGAL